MIYLRGKHKFVNKSTGEKIYRADVEKDGRKRWLNKTHGRASEALAYGLKVVIRYKRFAEYCKAHPLDNGAGVAE